MLHGLHQEDKAEGKEQDESKGIEMAGDFEGSLHDMEADPEADDQEQEEEGQERMDQVPSPAQSRLNIARHLKDQKGLSATG